MKTEELLDTIAEPFACDSNKLTSYYCKISHCLCLAVACSQGNLLNDTELIDVLAV
jgi:hypothetical protein